MYIECMYRGNTEGKTKRKDKESQLPTYSSSAEAMKGGEEEWQSFLGLSPYLLGLPSPAAPGAPTPTPRSGRLAQPGLVLASPRPWWKGSLTLIHEEGLELEAILAPPGFPPHPRPLDFMLTLPLGAVLEEVLSSGSGKGTTST